MRRTRLAFLSLLMFACGLFAFQPAQTPAFCAEAPKIAIERNTMVPMRDGVKLATDLYRPSGQGPFPVIVIRTPYDKTPLARIASGHAEDGYGCVVQDVRGRFQSEGAWLPFANEEKDGKDTIAWVKSQPWCNGKIGTWGGSYFGYTEWALAPSNPHVSALTPIFTTSDAYQAFYRGGAFYEMTWLFWSLSNRGGTMAQQEADKSMTKGLNHLPLIDADNVSLEDVPFFNAWVKRPMPDAQWKSLSFTERIPHISAPMFLVTGWYDLFNAQQLREFELIQKFGQNQVKRDTKILIGPWNHTRINPNDKNYAINAASLNLDADLRQWFGYELKGAANGWDRVAPVRLYVLGENAWRDEHEWPLARTVYTDYYLSSSGKANTSAGDGSLGTNKPGTDETPDTYAFDPMRPVPTVGGSNLRPEDSGPADQQEVEKREDVLVYSTAPLDGPIEITGPIELTLFASSDAPDTDFTGKLVDVFPDGKALILCEGILRARYRNGLDKPELMEPGKVYQYDIEMGCTSVLFQTGHKIRLEVSSSNFPRYDRNPNTGTEVATETRTRVAHQKVWHTAQYPSRLTLPVIPR